MKKVSVIVPCYNVEKYVECCLNSLVGQTIGADSLELILYDDKSTDGTLSILKKFENEYPEDIILVCGEKNAGLGAVRNRAIQYATAPYVTYVDSDDWLDLDFFSKLYEKATEYNCDFVACNMVRELTDGRQYKYDVVKEEGLFTVDSTEKRKRLLIEKRIDNSACKKLIRRDFLLDHDIFFSEGMKFEDILWGNLFYPYVNSFYLMKDYLYHYRENPASITGRKAGDEMRHLLSAHYNKWEEWEKRGVFSSMHDEAEFDFILEYYVAVLRTRSQEGWVIQKADFDEMKSFITEHFPDYAYNPYFGTNVSEGVRLMISLLGKELGQNELDQLSGILKTLPI